MKIAMIGVGAISGIYAKNITQVFHGIEIGGMYDIVHERAEKGADSVAEMGGEVPKVYKSVEEAYNDADIDIVLNLVLPAGHFEVNRQALLHGKHVYTEKPICVTMEEAAELVSIAESKGLYLGGAPDTFLGAGIQTCRRLIDSGYIGDIVGADCAMVCRGHETWHPDPEFFYKKGGGPMFDMGPYYITALLQLLGGAKAVTGMTKKSFNNRVVTSKPKFGTNIEVETDTHITGSVEFASGAIAQVITTFDVHYTTQARFEVYGTEGTLVVPDPNTFGGPVLLYRREDAPAAPAIDPALIKPEEISLYRSYRQIPLMFAYRENSRGLGVADMAAAIKSGREMRANGKLQAHTLEIMSAFSESSRQRKTVELKTAYDRAAPMVNTGIPGIIQ